MFRFKLKLLHRVTSPSTLAIVSGVLLTFCAVSVMAHSGGEVVSKKTPNPITIDGSINEWRAVFAESSPLQDIVADPQDWYQIIPGGGAGSDTNNGGLRVSRGQFDGNDDFLARWATVWDDNYLYFAFDVADQTVHAYANDVATRNGDIDGLWLLFDTRHDAPLSEFPDQEFNTSQVAGGSTYEADDHYWIFAPFTSRGASAAWALSSGSGLDPVLDGLANGHVAARETGNGYAVEIRLPWSVFEPFFGGPLVPADGMAIGFDITMTDIDGDPPGTYAAPLGGAMAWSSDFENDNSPGVLGDLLISADPATSVDPAGKLPTSWGRIKGGYK